MMGPSLHGVVYRLQRQSDRSAYGLLWFLHAKKGTARMKLFLSWPTKPYPSAHSLMAQAKCECSPFTGYRKSHQVVLPID